MRNSVSFLPVLFLSLAAGCTMDIQDDDLISGEDSEFRDIFQCQGVPQDNNLMKAKFAKTALIRSTKVVEDICRSTSDVNVWNSNSCSQSTRGHWSFWYLMSQMSGQNDPSRFILTLLESFENRPFVNGRQLSARTAWKDKIINKWRTNSGCNTDWNQACVLKPEHAPFRLAAIVNRMDLRPVADGDLFCNQYGCSGAEEDNAGEVRFVFTILKDSPKLNANAQAFSANIILEYALPTVNKNRITWANDWLALESLDWNTGAYQTKLQSMTDLAVNQGAFPGRPNLGSAINTVRTNEKSLETGAFVDTNKMWSLRQFELGCNGNCPTNAKFLVPVPVSQTPDNSFLESDAVLRPFIDQNALAIRAGTHVVPMDFMGVDFLGAESLSHSMDNINPGPAMWAMDLQFNQDLLNVDDPGHGFANRSSFAFSTCNGCHYVETNNATNVHIGAKVPGQEAPVSDFMNGVVSGMLPINDALDVFPQFNEPQRRLCELLHTATGDAQTLTTGFGAAH